eukprot:9495834-Pyramimonas_sp.AAC.2
MAWLCCRFSVLEGAQELRCHREVRSPHGVRQAFLERRAARQEGDPRPGSAAELSCVGARAHAAGMPSGQGDDGGQPPARGSEHRGRRGDGKVRGLVKAFREPLRGVL